MRAHHDRDPAGTGPRHRQRAAVPVGRAGLEQTPYGEHVRLEGGELGGAQAEVPDPRAARADPDVDAPGCEIVDGRRTGGRHGGVPRERIRDPRAEPDALGVARGRGERDPRLPEERRRVPDPEAVVAERLGAPHLRADAERLARRDAEAEADGHRASASPSAAASSAHAVIPSRPVIVSAARSAFRIASSVASETASKSGVMNVFESIWSGTVSGEDAP